MHVCTTYTKKLANPQTPPQTAGNSTKLCQKLGICMLSFGAQYEVYTYHSSGDMIFLGAQQVANRAFFGLFEPKKIH